MAGNWSGQVTGRLGHGRSPDVPQEWMPGWNEIDAVGIVDDVYTSGATANAAASGLRKAGARRVEVVTFARAVRTG